MLDKMYALRRVAIDNEMPELAEVYEKKYKEIEANYLNAYQGAGYAAKAQGIEKKYTDRAMAFAEVFVVYIEVLCSMTDKKEMRLKAKRT
jgi:hypothetical protein